MALVDTLILLDTDPDSSPEFDDESDDDIDTRLGGIRLDDSDLEDYDFGEQFDFDAKSTVGRFSSAGSSLHGYGVRPERVSTGIKYSSIGTYGHLFDWDFERYSFPSGQLRIKRLDQKAKGTKPEDEGARAEVERLKRELRAELGEVGHVGGKDRDQLARRDTRSDSATEKPTGIIHGDLLGEFTEPPLSLLDLDDMETEYSWTGPIRDIETGRPLTPFKDDPPSSPSSSSRGGSRQTGLRSRPFTPGRGRGHGRATPNGNGNGAQGVLHKTSTQSLPSALSRGRGRGNFTSNGRVHHQPSLPAFTSNSNRGHDQYRRPKNTASPYARLLSKPQARRFVPEHMLNTTSRLQLSIILSWKQTCADRAYQQAVLSLLEWLTNSINLMFDKDYRGGKGRFEVDVFGSVSWGGETGTSGDLDMVIIDHEQPQGYMPDLWRVPPGETPPPRDRSQRSTRVFPGLPGVYDLYKLSGLLRNLSMQGVTTIRGANTPIVKFKVHNFDSQTRSLDCDINVNDLGGWHNSSLILAYCEISPFVLRPLIHALKLWSSSQGLNDPSGAEGLATMSSYCLTLMAIAYLQMRGHLPNLQAKVDVPVPSYPTDRNDPDLVWVAWGKPQGIHAHVAFSRDPPADWKSTDSNPDLTSEQALRGFFAYFGPRGEVIGTGPMIGHERTQVTRRFEPKRQVLSILNGGVMGRAEKLDDTKSWSKESQSKRLEQEGFMGKGDLGIQPAKWREKTLIVQDPFIWQKNCTTSMHAKGLEKWFEAVDRADTILRSRGNEATLADILVPPPPDLTPPTGKGSKAKRGPKPTGDAVERFAQRVQGSRGRGGRGGSAPSVNGRSQGGPAVGQLLDV